MINFKGKEGIIFNYRAVAVIKEENYILLHKSEEEQFWSLPGGRVEFGESSEKAVIRELKEEVNIDGKVLRMLWYVEDFYKYKEESYHEIATYYLVELLDSKFKDKEKEFYGEEGEKTLIYKWFNIKDLDKIELYPIFLKTKLNNLKENIEKIVQC